MAKPNSDFCTRTDISSFIKKTNDEPSIVPSSGISSPITNVVVIVSKGITFYRIAKYSNLMKCKKKAEALPLITPESREIYSREIKNIEIMANQATLSNLDNVSKFVIEIIPCEL